MTNMYNVTKLLSMLSFLSFFQNSASNEDLLESQRDQILRALKNYPHATLIGKFQIVSNTLPKTFGVGGGR